MTTPRLSILITAGCALICSRTAEASVIYSNLQDISIPTNFDGVYLDIDTGATGTAEFTGWDVNPFFGGYGVVNSPAFQPVRTGTGAGDQVLRLNVGDIIDSARNFATGYGDSSTHIGVGATQFPAGSDAYLGFKFTTNASAGPYYGWLRVVFTVNTSGGLLKDWAYETTDSSITAGRVLQSAPVANVQTTTLSGGTGESYTLASALSNSGANTTNVVKTAAGQWAVAGTNTFTGTTTVDGGTLEAAAEDSLGGTSNVTINTGGTLLLSNSGTTDRINDSATITMSGGTIAVSGNVTEGSSPGTGALTLTANSIIDFLGGNAVLNFGASNLATWTGGATLSIYNWGGLSTGGGNDQLIFGSNSTALTSGQLGQISFYSGAGTGFLGTGTFVGSLGEVVPVPEPSSLAVAIGLLGLIGARERRQARQAGRTQRRKVVAAWQEALL